MDGFAATAAIRAREATRPRMRNAAEAIASRTPA
jgi:hypothetical protein